MKHSVLLIKKIIPVTTTAFSLVLVLVLSPLNLLAAETATEIVEQVIRDYGKRFDSNGKYIDNIQLTENFIKSQNAAIQKIKANKYNKKSIKITNTADSKLVVVVTVLQENTSGNLAGILVERSRYDTKMQESLLRVYNMNTLNAGMAAVRYEGKDLVHFKSSNMNPLTGGNIVIRGVSDFKANTYTNAEFKINRANNNTSADFNFITPSNMTFAEIKLDVWYNIFSQNFGISKVTFIQSTVQRIIEFYHLYL